MNWIILLTAGLFEVAWAIGTAILSIILFGESANAMRLISLGLILAGIVGLKLATPD